VNMGRGELHLAEMLRNWTVLFMWWLARPPLGYRGITVVLRIRL
jgi:hypothetical protein